MASIIRFIALIIGFVFLKKKADRCEELLNTSVSLLTHLQTKEEEREQVELWKEANARVVGTTNSQKKRKRRRKEGRNSSGGEGIRDWGRSKLEFWQTVQPKEDWSEEDKEAFRRHTKKEIKDWEEILSGEEATPKEDTKAEGADVVREENITRWRKKVAESAGDWNKQKEETREEENFL